MLTPEQAIAHVEIAGAAYATATAHETSLEDNRHVAKLDAMLRVMQTSTNALTGKPHSASSAEAVVEMDHEYAAYRANQRDAVRETIKARAAFYAAQYSAQLIVGLATH